MSESKFAGMKDKILRERPGPLSKLHQGRGRFLSWLRSGFHEATVPGILGVAAVTKNS